MFFSDVLRAPSYPSGFIPLSLTIQSALRKNWCRPEPSILVLTKGIVGSGDENVARLVKPACALGDEDSRYEIVH